MLSCGARWRSPPPPVATRAEPTGNPLDHAADIRRAEAKCRAGLSYRADRSDYLGGWRQAIRGGRLGTPPGWCSTQPRRFARPASPGPTAGGPGSAAQGCSKALRRRHCCQPLLHRQVHGQGPVPTTVAGGRCGCSCCRPLHPRRSVHTSCAHGGVITSANTHCARGGVISSANTYCAHGGTFPAPT